MGSKFLTCIMLVTYILPLLIGSAVAAPQFNEYSSIENSPQFTGYYGIEEDNVLLPEDLSVIDETQDGSIEADDEYMPERNEDGLYRVDDMLLDETQYKINFGNFGTEEERQAAGKSYKWPNGIVPYKFEESVPDSRKKKIRAAIAVMNKAFANCITIKETTSTSANHVSVIGNQAGCYSRVGYSEARTKGKQIVSLGQHCEMETVIQHEFLHTIGAYHVQSRSDRDTYVTIKWNNIKPSYKNQFTKQSKAPTYGLPYDGLSIMHYPSDQFAIDQNKPTIVSKMSSVPTKKLGKAKAMRAYDIKLIRKMYGCNMTFTTPKPSCNDVHNNCAFYKQMGYCKLQNAKKFMSHWCKKTCNYCNV